MDNDRVSSTPSPVSLPPVRRGRGRPRKRSRSAESDSEATGGHAEEREYFPAAKLFEYKWPLGDATAETYMIQEQVGEYLDIRGMGRKFPDMVRRTLDMQEKKYLLGRGVVTETQCNMGLVAVLMEEVHELMVQHYPRKYREYMDVLEQRAVQMTLQRNALEARRLSLWNDLSEKPAQEQASLREEAVHATARFNATLAEQRRTSRKQYYDTQTKSTHVPLPPPVARSPSPDRPRYPVALLPGQYCDFVPHYSSQELHRLPLNTVMDMPNMPTKEKPAQSVTAAVPLPSLLPAKTISTQQTLSTIAALLRSSPQLLRNAKIILNQSTASALVKQSLASQQTAQLLRNNQQVVVNKPSSNDLHQLQISKALTSSNQFIMSNPVISIPRPPAPPSPNIPQATPVLKSELVSSSTHSSVASNSSARSLSSAGLSLVSTSGNATPTSAARPLALSLSKLPSSSAVAASASQNGSGTNKVSLSETSRGVLLKQLFGGSSNEVSRSPSPASPASHQHNHTGSPVSMPVQPPPATAATATATAAKQAASKSGALCKICFKSRASNQKGEAEDLLECSQCHSTSHPSCWQMSATVGQVACSYNWQCLDCKMCQICSDPGAEDRMVCCDQCDRGYHSFCLGLDEIPSGQWLCPQCGQCASCGCQSPGVGSKWKHEYSNGRFLQTLCVDCSGYFRRGYFCPVCLKVYHDDETDSPMVCCDACDRWIHTDCDDISEQRYKELSQDNHSTFTCCVCRGSVAERVNTFHKKHRKK